MFTSSSSKKTLSEPLLGLEKQQKQLVELDDTEVSYEDDDCCCDDEIFVTKLACQDACYEDDEEFMESECDTCDSVTAIFVFPVLLAVQFILPYYSSSSRMQEENVLFPPLHMIAASIVLFGLASLLYKYSLGMSSQQQQQPTLSCGRATCTVLSHLLPEVWANAVLAILLVTHDATLSLQILLVGNLVLAAGGVVRAMGACRRLVMDSNHVDVDVDVDDGEELDELETSYYRGRVRSCCCV